MTAETIRRLLIEALAHGDDYDAFRTRLRAALKDADAGDDPPPLFQPAPRAIPCFPHPQTSA
ncbi:hypothetical protein LG047_12780 [Methylocystis sp. WRRC1]|uniref:hypothetical protein n=1 Tax=unclassified Methylocystis TaxID=2625913 RepID=UPI0001F8683D|nr:MULTISPECIES: hypothetical protein [unclassified Methylocystis]MCC3246185.1 hypothetical protein [Methylocystis sp. WRRC1]